jgi:hypothetical protein
MVTYSNLTKEEINSFISSFVTDGMTPGNERTLSLVTGQRGMEQFHKTLLIKNLEDMLEFLTQQRRITTEQHNNLKSMLHASYEDFVLAQELIKTL